MIKNIKNFIIKFIKIFIKIIFQNFHHKNLSKIFVEKLHFYKISWLKIFVKILRIIIFI